MVPILKKSFALGLHAAKKNWLPGLILQFVMAAIVGSYFLWPQSAYLLLYLSILQQKGGILFSFIATGIAGGIISELCKVYLLQKGKWKSRNLENMGFRFVLFGIHGVVGYYFIQFQAFCFGSVPTLKVVATKVFMDEVVFTGIWAMPYYTIGYGWQKQRYHWRETCRELRKNYFSEVYFPSMISSLCFWIPIAVLVYVMPLLLQMPIFILAIAFWSLLLVTLSRQDDKDDDAELENVIEIGQKASNPSTSLGRPV